jgi:hypothetical protein
LQEAALKCPNTVCSSAWANRTQSPACKSTVLALLVTKQNQPKSARRRRAAQKRQKSERSSKWATALQKAALNGPNTVCSSAWANRTQSPNCQSTVLALLVTKQFSAKIGPKSDTQKRQKSERSLIWAAALQEAALYCPNTVYSSAWANRTQPPACQSTDLALLVTKQFSAKISEIGEQPKKGKNRRGAQTGLLHCRTLL